MKKKPKKRMNQPGLTKDYKRFPLPYSSCMNGDYYDEFSCPPLIGFPVIQKSYPVCIVVDQGFLVFLFFIY